MTISQQIIQSLRSDSHISTGNCGEENEEGVFDLDEHLRAASKKVLLQRINFVEAKQPYHINLKKLKSKYVILNPSQKSEATKNSITMSPALKVNAPSTTETSGTGHDGIPSPKHTIFSADKVELSWKKAMRAGSGLCNLGNTCFLNSALQCLAYTAPLANYLIHLDHRKHCQVNGQFCMLCAMQQHLLSIHSNSGQPIKPMYILKNLRMIAKHLQFGRQEDAHEFIRYSVDAMQKACLFGYPSKIDVHIKATTVIHQIFGGYLRSRVKCRQCKSVSDTYDPFLDLSLDINKQGCVDLQRCLEMFVRIEVLQGDNAYKCMECKSAVQACKKFSIHRAPNVLMIQLKRFSNFMGNKINKELVYPSKLNIGPYMSNKPESGLWYELYAVLVHSGYSCQSGHYYAYAKAPNGQWYCFNDSSVHQVSVNQALNQQAYLLFYSKNPKASTQLGNLKSVNKNLHGMPMNKPHHSGVANRIKPALIEHHKFNNKPVIGPQLPPGFKRDKEYTFSSNSSSSDTGSPMSKQFNNQTKLLKNAIKPSAGSLNNNNRQPLQFTLNRKPNPPSSINITSTNNNIANRDSSKFSNGVHTNMTKSRSFNDQNNTSVKKTNIETKSSTLPANCSTSAVRSPILDKFMNDSNVAGPSSSSANTSHSSLSSTTTSVGLKALVSYSSGDDDENDDESQDASTLSYTTMTSTLQQLRQESGTKSKTLSNVSISNKKVTVKRTVFLPVGVPKEGNENNESKISKEISKSGLGEIKQDDRVPNSKEMKAKQVKQSPIKAKYESNGNSGSNVVTKTKKKESPCKNQPFSNSESASEREPILLVLNNEINSAGTSESDKKSENQSEDEPAATKITSFNDKKKHSSDEMKSKEKHGHKNGIKENGYSNGHASSKEKKDHHSHYENDYKKHSRSKMKESKKSKKEKKHQYSSDSSTSTSSSLPSNRKNKDERKRHCDRSESPADRSHNEHSQKSSTPTKKRKRDKSEHRRYSDDEYDSDDSYDKRKEKKHKSSGNKKRDSVSKKTKKEQNRHFYSPLKRSHSKSNSHYSDYSESDSPKRHSSIEALYCDKEEFEQCIKRKAKKEKKKRLKKRKLLQTSINEKSPSVSDHEKHTHREHRKKNKSGEKSHKSREHSNTKDYEKDETSHTNGDQHHRSSNGDKNYNQDHKEKQHRESSSKERPNILAQLLRQSSGKAYGTKVDSWNGGESIVEKDAQQTYAEQRAASIDDWDREYDKGKVKKVKKKDHHHHSKHGPVHNLFQKFQNIKNHRNDA
ncbi:uncharacterized protein LOC120337459 isoform X1 [Styela clava]